jgi:rare lipoprotein A
MKNTSFTFTFPVRVGLTCCALLVLAASSFGGSTKIPPEARPNSQKLPAATTEIGIASYYGAKYHGRPTASGEVFNMNDFTAAHPKLAFGTRLKVTHLENHRTVIVRINDRGPFVEGRVIDLSQAAALELQMTQSGLAAVKVEVLQ